jgi:hypothetical protein
VRHGAGGGGRYNRGHAVCWSCSFDNVGTEAGVSAAAVGGVGVERCSAVWQYDGAVECGVLV